jgi:hypothetical protein
MLAHFAQIIAQLEEMPRQAYTGSLGYISSNGKMDFNILIRTLTQQNDTLVFRAGAGIVFDSIAERELQETQHKAKGILKIFTRGVLAVVEDGDEILIDAENNILALLVGQSIIDKRLSNWTQPKPNYTKGVLAKFAKLAKSASEGAVTD